VLNRDALTSGHPRSEWLLVVPWTVVWWIPILARDVCGPIHPYRILDSSVVGFNAGLATLLWLIVSVFLVLFAVIGARLAGKARGNLLAAIAALEVGVLVWGAPWVAHAIRYAGVPRSLTSVISLAMGCAIAIGLVLPATRLFRGFQLTRLFGSIGAAAIAIWLYQGQTESDVWLSIGIAISALALWLPQRVSLYTASTATAVSVMLAISLVELPVSPSPSADAADSKPHVVILLIDTLRADHLEIYGHEISTSPALKRRLKGSVTVFTDATAGASSTVPSVKSLFSGRASTAWGLNEWGRPPPLNTWTLFHQQNYSRSLL